MKNNITIIGSSQAYIKFNYSGSNDNVKQLFSPLNSGYKGFTLIDVNVIASNCRYCMHDERGYSTDEYHNIYKNCNFYLDNTNNTAWTSKSCLGGGLGKSGSIDINGCIFESKNAENDNGVLSYHNNAIEGSKSNLRIINNYLKTGTIRFAAYGDSTEKSVMLVGNNHINSEYIVTKEVTTAPQMNIELINLNA